MNINIVLHLFGITSLILSTLRKDFFPKTIKTIAPFTYL